MVATEVRDIKLCQVCGREARYAYGSEKAPIFLCGRFGCTGAEKGRASVVRLVDILQKK